MSQLFPDRPLPKMRRPAGVLTTPEVLPQPEELLNIDEVMAMLKTSRNNIYVQMRRNRFPRPLAFFGKRVKWRRSTIEQFVRSLDSSNLATLENTK